MFRKVLLSLFFIFCLSELAFTQTASGEREQIGNSVVEIIIQPEAAYTDKARKKKVQGVVLLEVTFLANGEIGDVDYFYESSEKKKLTKYGLVERAIEAAKKIKFKPAIKDGQPFTVKRTIAYEFTY